MVMGSPCSNKSNAFLAMNENTMLDKEHVYWVRFSIGNNTNDDLNLTLYLGGIDFFDFYTIQTDSLEAVHGGGLMPA